MLKQGLSQKLLQKLSPQQIQFIQLLQLNTTELEKRVDEELTENPALENDKTENGETEAGDDIDNFNLEDGDIASKADEDVDDNEFDGDAEIESINYDDDYDEMDISQYMGDDDSDYAYSGQVDPDDDKREIPFANTSTLFESLTEQLDAMRLDEREKELAKHLIGMLEEDGYLRRPLKNIAYDLAFLNQLQTTEQELEKILRVIQNLDPPGIGARSLEECLMIQLNKKVQTPEVLIAKKVLHEHMDDLAKKHYERLMKSLKIDRDQLKDVIEVITHLNPKPGEAQTSVKTQYIIPDFIVTQDEGELQVMLNSKNTPELKISREYHDALKGYQESSVKSKAQKNQVQFIKQKLDSAKWFIDAIKQRQNTLLQTMRSIVELQKDFFLTGDIEKQQPMILKDIADRVNMDISTVSRVANSKYVQTDYGIFSLKDFFSEGIQTESGEEVSNKEVKQILKDYIDNESKKRPLTDEKLTDLLNEKGYNIARRTVAKYREQMNIPVARLRKEI